jgi:hypothetical protein
LRRTNRVPRLTCVRHVLYPVTHEMCAQAAEPQTQEPMMRFHLFIERSLRRDFERLAAMNERTVAGEMRLALRKYVQSQPIVYEESA